MSVSVELRPDIRRLAETDSLQDLTELLHRAYAPLANAGLRYRSTDQDVSVTRRNAEKGECYVMVDDDRIIGTITLFLKAMPAAYCAWYDQPWVCHFGQLAVEPVLQRRGLGGMLLDFVEERARGDGATEIALVADAQWGHTNYRSVILSKTL